MERSLRQGTYERIYAVVRNVSAGRVATYGQIASVAGLNRGARQVGYALHSLAPATAVPWHRVLNAKGEISRRAVYGGELFQRMLLEREGIVFDARGRVNLAHFGWRRRPAAPLKRNY
jgi:methylated-DNA-protein-cysteine methyltransferase-like protein